jgi:hypothetical protein
MIELAIQILLVILAGAFAVGSVIVYAEMRTQKNYMNKLPKRREDVSDTFQKKPLTGKGQFDKQRTTYTEGDNT